MATLIHILHLEDDPADAELIRAMVEKAGIPNRVTLVRKRDEYTRALRQNRHEIILADFTLPGYDGISALRLAKELRPDLPFIFVSGTMGEEAAIEGLTHGATDYVLKHNLSRLPAAVKRALNEARNRRQRQQAEKALAESEHKMRSILDNIGVGIALISPEMEILEMNRRMYQWFPDVDARGHPLCYQALCTPARRQICSDCPSYKTLQDGRVHDTTTQISRNDTIRNYRIVSSPLLNADGEIVAAIEVVDDITARLRDATKLRQTNEMLEAIIAAAPVAVFGLDLEARVHSVWNPAAEKMLGWSAQEVMGRRLPSVPEDRQEEFEGLLKRIRNGETLTGVEVRRQRRDGTPIDYSIYASPLHDAQGRISGNITVLVDITEKKKYEDHLRQVHKMEAIGQLAGGIAHDFNNILSAITGYTELSQSLIERESTVSEYLEQVMLAGKRAKGLIDQILMFSRETDQQLLPIRLSYPVKEALKLIKASVPVSIEIRSEILSEAIALADPTQIHQIVMNLCTNAAHAMGEEGGLCEVKLTDITIAPPDIGLRYPDAEPGDYVRLTVADQGHGIDRQHLHRIFDPFFTTKKAGEGTGMGLSVVHGIVKSYGGFIYVHSRLGEGTTIEILIPARECAPIDSPVPDEPIPTGSESILFVDDETMIVDVVGKMLVSLGYRVVAKTSGREALEAFKNNPDDFDLVVTDMAMPKMSGLDLAEEILRIKPGIPIVLCTGFDVKMDAAKLAEHGLRDMIRKPVLKRDMATVVRKSLDGAIYKK